MRGCAQLSAMTKPGPCAACCSNMVVGMLCLAPVYAGSGPAPWLSPSRWGRSMRPAARQAPGSAPLQSPQPAFRSRRRPIAAAAGPQAPSSRTLHTHRCRYSPDTIMASCPPHAFKLRLCLYHRCCDAASLGRWTLLNSCTHDPNRMRNTGWVSYDSSSGICPLTALSHDGISHWRSL